MLRLKIFNIPDLLNFVGRIMQLLTCVAVGLAAALRYLRKDTKRVAIAIISGGNVDLAWFYKTISEN